MSAMLLAVALSALLAGCAGQQGQQADAQVPVAVPPAVPQVQGGPQGGPQGAPPSAPQGASQGTPLGAPSGAAVATPSLTPAPVAPAVVAPDTNLGPSASATSAPVPPPPAPEGGPPQPQPSASTTATATPGTPAGASASEMPEQAEQAAEEDPEEEEQPACVHVPRELCPPANELCRCLLVNGTSTGVCCDVTSVLQLKESLNCQSLGSNITALHARNITLHSLDVSVLNLTKLHLPQLESLAITDGHIVELKGNLEARNLACLNLSSNSLISVSNSTFASLHSLQNLDLSGNEFRHLIHLNSSVPEFQLDVSRNDKLSCESIWDLIKHSSQFTANLQFRHENNTHCLASRSFHWFNSTDRMSLSSLMVLNKLEQECPRGESEPCICRTAMLDMILKKTPKYSFSVDCSNKRLTKLPATLPKNTISLNISSNKISDLQELSINANYESIREFFADDNQITSITALEGSTFIENFVILSLRSNNITSLPTYMLSNVFNRNWDEKIVRLGLNRFKCDCSTAQSTKMWLNANYKHIPDYNEVLCENMREKVFELDQYKVCTVQSDWTDYVYYLVAAEVMLLILLISKVSYDYWVFKTAGYLPWPASKMPKLPCDWVFES
ncbi:protein halfway [Thrips palmi]|uniref:Protein halfway n=1 Tax=Thrips palmi TaxID=161013 RepID=A0A6P8YJF0_THRPL|nr:protein halfway [Thrips palmi]